MKRENDYIYFIKPLGMDGPIKIGCSNLPDRRLEQLATWSPFPLEIIGTVPGTMRDEHFLHCCFAESHTHKEWFNTTDRLITAIQEILTAGTVEVARKFLRPQRSMRAPRQPRSYVQRKVFSYQMRVVWAEKKLRRSLGEKGAFRTPSHIAEILSALGAYGTASRLPNPDEERQLEAFLSDPASQSVLPEWLSKRSRMRASA